VEKHLKGRYAMNKLIKELDSAMERIDKSKYIEKFEFMDYKAVFDLAHYIGLLVENLTVEDFEKLGGKEVSDELYILFVESGYTIYQWLMDLDPDGTWYDKCNLLRTERVEKMIKELSTLLHSIAYRVENN
jgi:hypothetical protein